MTRLETISKSLNDKILKQNEDILRKIIVEASGFAVTKATLEEDIVKKVYENLKKSIITSKDEREQIERLLNYYEERYFELYEKEEEEKSSTREYLYYFNNARALSTLLLSLADQELAFTATEVVYEASAVVDDKNELFEKIDKVLR